ncbi:MAG: polysaccharide deacetylase family protein [Clostridia bacterium]|nr:polysaccharide deacetylase family protein [Clostridia bacterium]
MITKRMLIIGAIAAIAVIAAIVIAIAVSDSSATAAAGAAKVEEYELEVLAGTKRELPVYSVAREDKKIALTIDAAWEDDKTEFILETLKKYDIKATFFLCGFWVEKYPDQVKAIHEAGHELGNHTATHPHMSKLSEKEMIKELEDFEKLMEKTIGERTKIFRAPYGEYDDRVITTVRKQGYEVLQWDIDTVDWKEERSAKTILDSVLPKLHPGCIILSHNNGYKIKEYLPVLIETAIKEGYEFVTVSELLLEGETLIDVNGVQKKAG